MGSSNYRITELVGESDFINNIKKTIEKVAQNNAAVLLCGESGTGKRLIAQNIHSAAGPKQSKSDFYEINCKVADDANFKMIINGLARFIPAEKKVTLFINHIDELNPELQKYFLESIRQIRNHELRIKIICSCEVNLELLVNQQEFLSDLYYQLNTIVINTIPLRQRTEDILPIAEYYRNLFALQSGIKLLNFAENAKKEMMNQFWKGNVDELINAVQKAFMIGEEPVIKIGDLGITSEVDYEMPTLPLHDAIEQFKKKYITKVLEENGWNQTKTAQILGIQRTYVIKLIKEYEIRKNK